jgi:hypothetical protein
MNRAIRDTAISLTGKDALEYEMTTIAASPIRKRV